MRTRVQERGGQERGGKERASGPVNWFDQEPPLGRSLRQALGRAARRSLGSWPIWVGVAVALTAWVTYQRIKHPPAPEVTVVIRATETQRTAGVDLSAGALRAHVGDLAFRSENLIAVMKAHPGIFTDVVSDPPNAVEEIRRQITVSISETDFIEDRLDSDPPRCARIAITFRGGTPDVAWAVAQALGQLVIKFGLDEEGASLGRERLAAESATRQAESRLSGAPASGPSPVQLGTDRLAESTVARWKDVQGRASSARLTQRAAEQSQGLRLEVVDPGRVPAPYPKSSQLADALTTLLIALLAAGLLAGVFDARILDADDLADQGVGVLGHLPPLPGSDRSSHEAGKGEAGKGEAGRGEAGKAEAAKPEEPEPEGLDPKGVNGEGSGTEAGGDPSGPRV